MKRQKTKIMVTGGAGFMGSHFVRHLVNRGYKPIVVDSLSYAADRNRLRDIGTKYRFIKCDICNLPKMEGVFKKCRPDAVVHFAAATHVDRSNIDPQVFLMTNVHGTQILVHLSKKFKVRRFIHISTDEVYGSKKTGQFKETDKLDPHNPYAASKAVGEYLVQSAIVTSPFPGIIIRPTNTYGPWQFPEKFVPVACVSILKGKKIPVYGRGKEVREWIYIDDCVSGIYTILKSGKLKETYNLGSQFEQSNLKTAKMIACSFGMSEKNIRFVKNRINHDFRYSVNSYKVRKLGWKPKVDFPDGLTQTTQWFKDHSTWAQKRLWQHEYK